MAGARRKIFISHSSRDAGLADLFARCIHLMGGDTFVDTKHLTGGSALRDELRDHMATCQELLIILSPPALDSHWLSYELGAASSFRLEVFPILHDVTDRDVMDNEKWRGLVADMKLILLADVTSYLDRLQGRLNEYRLRSAAIAQQPFDRAKQARPQAQREADFESAIRAAFPHRFGGRLR